MSKIQPNNPPVKKQPFKFWGKLDYVESVRNGAASKVWTLFQAVFRSSLAIVAIVLIVTPNEYEIRKGTLLGLFFLATTECQARIINEKQKPSSPTLKPN